ncbi:DUF4156 domain-containing protein [Endozoicomonas sp. SCSIO W0465]|uniref:DUF4156 domain-containing protein n=1 Tax=Endozoicomonas sp. SCSIO W0465 TaxID=2918516 RepID=UPI0020760400|nr:DUF4156 domain-containing protein [Endozoicomonas sp. SCSIO W0465]USE35775.1 DUF4156 domain-containing protein [Endozoicomonas sp. SCSIO W0465]
MSLTGCITFPTEESAKVQVIWDETDRIASCELKGIVYGSEGHFYDYWLHSDRDMVWGTINQMSKKAVEMKADTLYLYRPFGFLSSVTMMANAYDCRRVDKIR